MDITEIEASALEIVRDDFGTYGATIFDVQKGAGLTRQEAAAALTRLTKKRLVTRSEEKGQAVYTFVYRLPR